MHKSIVTLLKETNHDDAAVEAEESATPAEDLVFLVGPKAHGPRAVQASLMKVFSKAGKRTAD